MLTLSYKNCVRLLRTAPICPKPQAVGLHNIPRNEPTLFVYNHVARRGEPVFLAVAAPPDPPIRFFIELPLVSQDLYERTEGDVRDSLFSAHFQERMKRRALMRRAMHGIARLMTRFLIAQMSRLNFIPVYRHDPPSQEEEIRKVRTNRRALKSCFESLSENIPVAIAPSGGDTHEKAELITIPTTVANLAEMLHRRGQVLKIVPSIIKERPEINKDTYKKYVADRILPYRLWRGLLDRMKIRRYERPRLTVEFLPPVTFSPVKPTKEDKLLFVRELQKAIYDILGKD